MDLLAIMGRGIQMPAPGSDPTKAESYAPTKDLEICDERSAHLPVRVHADDANPFCVVGGGELNLEAGRILIEQLNPLFVVCAYGDRADYLKSVDGPTESEVMSHLLAAQFKKAPTEDLSTEIVVWSRTRSLPVPSNTGKEILNIFDLALERGRRTIGIVTVGVHIPRTAAYVAKYLSRHEKYRDLTVQLFESEEVLQRENPDRYAARVADLRKSESFARSWEREAIGISKIVRDIYGDAAPKVEAK